MRVAVLASGGKDSSYAAWWATLQGWRIVALVTVGVQSNDSMMFQTQNTAIAGLQAASMGVPWLPVTTNGEEKQEMRDLEQGLSGSCSIGDSFQTMWPESFTRPDCLELHDGLVDIDGLVVGALRSDYQKTNIEMMCERLGISSFCPLWHHRPQNHMKSLLDHGFVVRFTSVSCEGLDEGWLGTALTDQTLRDLEGLAREFRFNLDGEGGEFETIVTHGPHLKREISCDGDSCWEGSRGVWVMRSCSLSEHR